MYVPLPPEPVPKAVIVVPAETFGQETAPPTCTRPMQLVTVRVVPEIEPVNDAPPRLRDRFSFASVVSALSWKT